MLHPSTSRLDPGGGQFVGNCLSGEAYLKKIQYNMDDDGNRTSVGVTRYGQGTTTTSYT